MARLVPGGDNHVHVVTILKKVRLFLLLSLASPPDYTCGEVRKQLVWWRLCEVFHGIIGYTPLSVRLLATSLMYSEPVPLLLDEIGVALESVSGGPGRRGNAYLLPNRIAKAVLALEDLSFIHIPIK